MEKYKKQILNIYKEDNESLKKLSLWIDESLIPNQKERNIMAEIGTPYHLRQEMLDTLPSSFWKKYNKIYECCCGKGGFLIDIIQRFMIGLKDKIKNNKKRYQYIVENLIYFSDLNLDNVEICKLLIDPLNQYKLNYVIEDSLKIDMKKTWDVQTFDAIISNPPYNLNQTQKGNIPIYNLFVEYFIDKCDYLLFVIPSRWFVGGKGLDKFRDFMLNRKDIELIEHEDDSVKWFGKNVSVEGGVCYFLKNKNHKGPTKINGYEYLLNKYDIIVKPLYIPFIQHFEKYEKLDSIYKGRIFGIESNDKRLKKKGKVKCYVSTFQSPTRVMYLDSYPFTKNNTFWKVFTAKANGNYPSFGYSNIAKPNETHTGSYLSFKVNNENEAMSLLSYLKTKLANFMLSSRKISQNISKDTVSWIPLVPLNKIWNDKSVYQYLKLKPSQIKIIENYKSKRK